MEVVCVLSRMMEDGSGMCNFVVAEKLYEVFMYARSYSKGAL